MTTLQPRLVRADTLDLQSHDAPSAKDHTRSPTFAPYTHGATGLHHREALRNAEESAYHDRKSSPRMSIDDTHPNSVNHSHQYDSTDDDGDDEQHIEQNGADHNDADYEEGNDENDDDLEDDLLDKISSSPSIEDEDIDFEFVYALHTFVATVEGQANATKGDTMVLLDDSNSYWWLVRVVKDGSIGYLPAEHIETPTERLARLNKHRNIDLSASMLGDNPEKSKNPLKKAMRRRNAKTVAFAAPTFYEPSEYDYDSEDDGEGEGVDGVVNAQQQSSQQSDVNGTQDTRQLTDHQESIIIVNGIKQVANEEQLSTDSPTSPTKPDATEVMSTQPQADENLQRSRNGIVRNTDSFFKDDTAETKKISLTPRLLRNDTDSTGNSEQDSRPKNSSDTFDKIVGVDDKSKEKEKKKEKKGMLSGLFKRKDKSVKPAKGDIEDERIDDSRSSQAKESSDSTPGPQSPDRKPGKLQKSPPIVISPKNSSTEFKQVQSQASNPTSPLHSPKISETTVPISETREVQHNPQVAPLEINKNTSTAEKRSIFAPITTVLKSTPLSSAEHDSAAKPVYSKRAKERFAIDGSDSEDDHTPTMSQVSQDHRGVSPTQTSQIHDSRTDSAMEVSPVERSGAGFDSQATGNARHHLTGEHDTPIHDMHGTAQSDTASTSKPSPSLATHTPSTSRSTPTWSDASLRSYMESDQDIRDLLIIVHDKSNVIPVGPDHPLMGGLFASERTRLAEMQTQLDSMLTTWISKKSPGLLAR